MVFSSLEFLVFFLPAMLAVYHLAPSRLRNGVALLASLVFYVWGGGGFVFVLLALITTSFVSGQGIARSIDAGKPHRARWWLRGGVATSLGFLVFFKYATWAVGQVNALSDALGGAQVRWSGVSLPVGVSFFAFHTISYLIDVHRGSTSVRSGPVDFALYIVLFPQLIAGPIVRYKELAPQLRDRSTNVEQFAAGAVRFSHGLAKKVLIADALAPIADQAFASHGPNIGVAWVGLVAYTGQIYFDFSGYSDMAVGLGKMLGFELPENFRRPYSAHSVTDFWRRWHITLSNWFRDYVYVPLGGSRDGSSRTYRNLIMVFVLTGVWHGANWTFLAWGVAHGAALLVERRFDRRAPGPGRHPLWRARTLLFVALAWVLFRAPSLTSSFRYYAALVDVSGLSAAVNSLEVVLGGQRMIALVPAVLVALLPGTWTTGPYLATAEGRWPSVARFAIIGIVFPLTVLILAASSTSPFIYFEF